MSRDHRASFTAPLLAVAALSLFASGCACMYGACGGSNEYLEYDGQRCSSLEGSSHNWHQLGFEGAKPHQMGSGEYYVTCFTYEGKKGTTLSVVVESSAFEPEIYIQRQGDDANLASGKGDRTARVTFTLPRNGHYGVIVTSRRPRDTGRFDLRFSTGSR